MLPELPPFAGDTTETRLAVTFYLVEANDFERHALWAAHSANSAFPSWNPRGGKRLHQPVEWQEINSGFMPQVGQLTTRKRGKPHTRPIILSMFWARIEGRLVCFWHCCSEVADYEQIKKWLNRHFGKKDKDGQPMQCDANTFHHCLQAIKRANAEASSL